MQIVSIPAMQDMIEFVAVRHRDPLMIWGPAGCGKSEGVAQVAARARPKPAWLVSSADDWIETGILVDVRLSQYDSVDLRGIPVPEVKQRQTVWHAPITLPFKGNPIFPDNQLIFLFLDELPDAVISVQGAAYQLINDRRIGEHRLMDNVVIIAAGNRTMDKGVTNRMPAPLANRFTHVEVEHDVDALCQHAQDCGKPMIAIAYWQWQKQDIATYDSDNPGIKAYASGRSWFKALDYFEDTSAPLSVRKASFAGAVGEGIMAKFYAFVEVFEKVPRLADIIADPKGTPLPEELSMIYATAVAVSGGMDVKNVDALHTYLERMDVEYVVLAWTLASRRDDMLMTTDAFVNRYSKKYIELFN